MNGATEISYTIELGKRHSFVYLGISGNKYFDEKTIRERMFLMPKSFEFRRGRYSEACLKRDIATIKDLYEVERLPRRRQSRPVWSDDYKGRTGDLAVFLTIEEGPQYLVSSLDIQGAKKLDLAKRSLDPQFANRTGIQRIQRGGGPRDDHPRNTARTVFPTRHSSGVRSRARGPTPSTCSLTIDEGQQQFVRQVVTNGLETTRPGAGGETDGRPESRRSAVSRGDGGYAEEALRSGYFFAGRHGDPESGWR